MFQTNDSAWVVCLVNAGLVEIANKNIGIGASVLSALAQYLGHPKFRGIVFAASNDTLGLLVKAGHGLDSITG